MLANTNIEWRIRRVIRGIPIALIACHLGMAIAPDAAGAVEWGWGENGQPQRCNGRITRLLDGKLWCCGYPISPKTECGRVLGIRAPQSGPKVSKQKAEKPRHSQQFGSPKTTLKAQLPAAAVAAPRILSAVTPPASLGTRVALVIGNSSYQKVAALPNPARDAELIAAALGRVGFQAVTVNTNLSREKLIDALRLFARRAENADWALVYFAGHGIEMGGVNYLIPTDAKLETDRDVQFEAVGLDQVLGAVDGAKKLRLVVLDACRNNPFFQHMRRSVATRSIGRGLAAIEPESGTLVAYAAKHRELALDGDEANSPFASAFVKYLEMPGVEVRRLFDFVRDDVLAATNRRQHPYTYGSLPASEDFFFVAAQSDKSAGRAQDGSAGK